MKEILIITIGAILFMTFIGSLLVPVIVYEMGIGAGIMTIILMISAIISLVFGLLEDQKELR